MRQRHVGVLGVGEDELLAAARVGVDAGEFLVEGFLHGSHSENGTLNNEQLTTSNGCRGQGLFLLAVSRDLPKILRSWSDSSRSFATNAGLINEER